MKKTNKKLISLLLCLIMAFSAAMPVLAAGQFKAEPTWQNTIESVTPVGDEPYVKVKLSAGGYKIEECRLPQKYTIEFKGGTSKTVSIPGEPDHVIPLYVYENYFDVETPDGVITLYAAVNFYADIKEARFSVGQYVLDGALGEDGQPVAGSGVYEFPIIEEKCESEIDEGNFIVRILYRLYTLWLKIENWFTVKTGDGSLS